MKRHSKDSPVALKIELKPNERILLGDCVVTNAGQRTRLTIEGTEIGRASCRERV